MESDKDLDTAYRQTVYRVYGRDGPVAFHVGEPNRALRKLLRSYGGDGAAFITAHNPGSRLLGAEHNRTAQALLVAQARVIAAAVLPGAAFDPQGTWPAEDSVLLVDIDPDAARGLGRRFGQNALVWIDRTGLPVLVWLT